MNKILIANRGEIAVRIIRACRELGLSTVAVYSTADADSLHVLMADKAVCVGPPAAKDSYLNMQAILAAALYAGADAIHPGYGFLAENETFAALCDKCGITYIGPSHTQIALMGNKERARQTMAAHGVPIVPGSDALPTYEDALSVAALTGYPLMVKAVAGGGGRGIRIVEREGDLHDAYTSARTEAKAAFGNDNVYIEKYLPQTRHIEFQILADHHGNVVHLGERDCSLQRRNQKVVEEAPAVILPDDVRKAMGQAAVEAAKAVGYRNAGTVEFLYDGRDFYFIEMNTRVQVEHPVTEEVTGIDVVKAQLRIAAGEPLWFGQDDVVLSGHSIECRINAENPDKNFMPSMGTIDAVLIPGGFGVRMDTHIYEGYKLPPHYDSMIGKVIVRADTRDEAIAKMRVALEDLTIEGVDTNIDYHLRILAHEDYVRNDIHTRWLNTTPLNAQ